MKPADFMVWQHQSYPAAASPSASTNGASNWAAVTRYLRQNCLTTKSRIVSISMSFDSSTWQKCLLLLTLVTGKTAEGMVVVGSMQVVNGWLHGLLQEIWIFEVHIHMTLEIMHQNSERQLVIRAEIHCVCCTCSTLK